ncbi:MAG: stage III sporulation AC/AD family protein [Anaerotruncus sp.]|nr:stage III sporulation AC/AD family protein [Anaerotruncus sp.]
MIGRVIGIALVALVFGIFFKQYNKTVALLLVLVSSLLVFWQSFSAVAEITDALKSITSGISEASSYIKIMFKVLGIALIAQLAADMCRDCGESALAGQTETAAKIAIIVVVLPLIQAVLKIVSGLVV